MWTDWKLYSRAVPFKKSCFARNLLTSFSLDNLAQLLSASSHNQTFWRERETKYWLNGLSTFRLKSGYMESALAGYDQTPVMWFDVTWKKKTQTNRYVHTLLSILSHKKDCVIHLCRSKSMWVSPTSGFSNVINVKFRYTKKTI